MRGTLVLAAVAVLAFAVWRAELFSVSRPGERPRALVTIAPERRVAVDFDVTLPVVPVGMERLAAGQGVLLVHYWAPWERHARDQVKALDSLRREPELEGLRIVVVCFDPFPSVTRYVMRQRLRLAVLLDGPGELRRSLPCPSLPFTYAIDRQGRIAAAQPGEVDWWAKTTRAALRELATESAAESANGRRPSAGTSPL